MQLCEILLGNMPTHKRTNKKKPWVRCEVRKYKVKNRALKYFQLNTFQARILKRID